MENRNLKVGEEFVLDNEKHYVTGFEGENTILKTFKDLWDETCCKGCKFIFKERGWLKYDRLKIGEKMPPVVACNLGQFTLTHNPMPLKKECKLRNYKYDQKADIRKYIDDFLKRNAEYLLKRKHKIAMIIEPTVKGMVQVVDVERLTVRQFVPVSVDD